MAVAGSIKDTDKKEAQGMKLEDLIQDCGTVDVRGDSTVDVNAVACDSRKVGSGTLFIAVRGFNADGNVFIPDAVRKGAVAVMTDSVVDDGGITVVRVSDARKAMAVVADRFYGSPQRSLVMTGVTGTNGKTTTSFMVKSIFDAGGMNCGVIGTINHVVAGKKIQSLNTTPEALDIHSFLARMVDGGQTACSMEVSSHALSLSRVYGIQFRAAAYLNLTRDHLDFHGDFKGYLDAKSILFSELPGDSTAVVNRDDAFADHILSVSRGANTLTFGESVASDIRPLSTGMTPFYSDVALATPAGEMAFRLPIPGRYNIYNAMAAAGIGLACGFPADVIVRGLETVGTVKGRYETVNEGQPFAVIVDYAHTPDALERILRSAREITPGHLIAVFGCGGDRDRGKRPIMGGIASREADLAIVTSDNPRTEDPEAIIADILEGIENRNTCEVLPDREEAIRRALEASHPGDTVVIAGKGHEDYQIIGTERRHFDDSETARRILRTMV
jgi:UDP-N-acetylmuramoyl-L-alanyl-D-glutamate--2,6-diaminopimelate ligase